MRGVGVTEKMCQEGAQQSQGAACDMVTRCLCMATTRGKGTNGTRQSDSPGVENQSRSSAHREAKGGSYAGQGKMRLTC